MAASSQKMLLQLRQELGLLQKSKEEAYIMADAFRIAFEQQLMRKNDQALRLTQTDVMCKKATKWINLNPLEEGLPSQRRKKTLGQKLLGMLPSEHSSKRTADQDNPQEVFKMLIDLVSIFAFFLLEVVVRLIFLLPINSTLSPYTCLLCPFPLIHHLPD